MEMRNFIIEMHTDGTMTWAEYAEPLNKDDRNRLFVQALESVVDELDTYPACCQTPDAKAAYLAGAVRMASILRKVLL